MLNKKNFNTKKIINLFFNIFGKKNRKSLISIINYFTEIYEKEGLISPDERKMFKNISIFSDKKINSIMTPHSDIIAMSDKASLDEIKHIITANLHTRIPIYKDTIEHIIGFIHTKDLAKFLCTSNPEFDLSKIMRKILIIPCSMRLLETLKKMRSSRVHIAIVLDEFGAVDGLVTIENLVEEIVGEIDDEHDMPSESSLFKIKQINATTYQFGGRVEIKKLEELFNIKIEECEAETIGGLSNFIFKNIPPIGSIEKYKEFSFKILDANSKIVKLVEIKKINLNQD
jgi:CBS domain containing-hemolysin-like protein